MKINEELLISENEINNILNHPGVVVNNYKYIRPDNKKRAPIHSIICSIEIGEADELSYDFIEKTDNGYDIWRGGHQALIAAICRRYEKPFRRNAEKIFSRVGNSIEKCYSDIEIQNNKLFVRMWAASYLQN